MSEINLVIVESPAKAKTINKYLGKDYKVLASYGHVRDLPSKDGSVDPDNNFEMVWDQSERAGKTLKEIFQAVKNAKKLFLATDPDREGEAISWHIQEILEKKNLLQNKDIKRVTFNQITKSSVQEAFANPRTLDIDLVNAYLARRALDYLVGFNLSPILWRKVPGSKSAGRVQSVALRLICDREAEREVFKAQEYWSVEAALRTKENKGFSAKLTVLNKQKLNKFSLSNESMATNAVKTIEKASLQVLQIEKKQVARNPHPPFITSTLQQEASRKLGFGTTQTMRIAQQLYEGADIGGETIGLITYMRTDGITLGSEAIEECTQLIASDYGSSYVPKNQRVYKSRAKNAQEAHEAIRPTSIKRKPENMKKYLSADQLALYDLIWKRTVASCMTSAILNKVAIDIGDEQTVVCRANGSVINFDGFLTLYHEDYDDDSSKDEDDEEKILPPMHKGDIIHLEQTIPSQHFTQPPPRYTEASLVKKMEELGIGRPSTYASILQVLQDRNYAILDKKRFVPEDRGRIVTTFLERFFSRYVEFDFTADLEEKLDDISGGHTDWKKVLNDFWVAFSSKVEETKGLTLTEVIDALNEDLGPHFFPEKEENKNPRQCPSCDDGQLGLKLGKFGAFIGCSNYPSCKYTQKLTVPSDDEGAPQGLDGPKILGDDPKTGMPVSLRQGPYGFYVQLGPKEDESTKKTDTEKETEKNKKRKDKAEKPKRSSLPKGIVLADVDLAMALDLLSLPRDVGAHPETGKMITAGIGRFGPYVKHETTYKSIPAEESVLTIGLNRAVDLLATASKKSGSSALKELGDLDKKKVTVHSGRYGPYVKHGKTMASLPKNITPEDITLEQAKELLDNKKKKASDKKPSAKKITKKKK